MNKEKKGWIRNHWQPIARLATVAMISLAPCLVKDKTVFATNNAEVGGLAIEPIHLIVGEAGRFEYKDWNLSRLLPGGEDNPELLVRQVGTGYPKQLLLTTTVTTEGVKICAYNYPETETCDEVEGASVSQYLIKDTGILSTNTYLEVGSTRLKILKGPGRYTIVMDLTDPATSGLAASSSATIEVPDIKKTYLPLINRNVITADSPGKMPANNMYDRYLTIPSLNTWRPSTDQFPHLLDPFVGQTGDYFYPSLSLRYNNAGIFDYVLKEVVLQGRVRVTGLLTIKACYNTDKGEECKTGTDITSAPRRFDIDLPNDSRVYNFSPFRYVVAEKGYGEVHFQPMLRDGVNMELISKDEEMSAFILFAGEHKSYLPFMQQKDSPYMFNH